MAPPALFLLGVHYMKDNKALAALAFVAALAGAIGVAVMASPEANAIKGAAQRLADFSLFAWMFAAALILTRKKDGRAPARRSGARKRGLSENART